MEVIVHSSMKWPSPLMEAVPQIVVEQVHGILGIHGPADPPETIGVPVNGSRRASTMIGRLGSADITE